MAFCRLLLLLVCVVSLKAMEPSALAQALADNDRAVREEAVTAAEASGDPRLALVLDGYARGMLALEGETVLLYQARIEDPALGRVYPVLGLDGTPLLTNGQPRMDTALPKDLIRAKGAERRAVSAVIRRMSLRDPDPARRRAAIMRVAETNDQEALPDLEAQLQENPDDALLQEAVARLTLGDPARQIESVRTLGELRALGAKAAIEALEAQEGSALASARNIALAQITTRQTQIRTMGHLFSGLSLASILVLLALGLSISFGLMGVINMAHGEMMMVGAYASWGVSLAFQAWAPSLFDWYPVVAVPVAFLAAALVGLVLEGTVLRHLYKRPLETLLATWGVSLILIQIVRVLFGDLQSVTPPSWLSGSVNIGWIELPTNRIGIIVFCVLCVLAVWLIMRRTPLGLLIRATTQSRHTASSLGVDTRRVDRMTFALASGLAGLAGVVVPLVDKINPQMGQGYVVDSFLVVVTGGVGNLAGVVWSGLGLGMATKAIEPWLEAVFTKVTLMGLIIVFLQMRPGGLFPARGRLAET